MIRLLRTTRRAALDLVFPPACNCCGRELCDEPRADEESRLFCSNCLLELPIFAPPYCRRCGCSVPLAGGDDCGACRKERYRFDETVALGAYQDKLRELLLEMKHELGEATSLAVARLMWSRCGERLGAVAADLIVPVPMYWLRRLWRGTNSAQLVGEVLARRLRVPLETGLLYRRRNTIPQSALTRTERVRNLRDALAVRSGYALAGARVLLVDDIMTTGSTASEAARALKRAGASHVAVAVVARSTSD